MNKAEQQILENQVTILHGLRIILSILKAPPHQFMTMQDSMGRTEKFINEHKG